MIEPDRPQMTLWSMPSACCIVKATDMHSEYAILIAFQRHQLFPRTRLNVTLCTHRLACVLCVQTPLLQRIALGHTFERRAAMRTLVMANTEESVHGK